MENEKITANQLTKFIKKNLEKNGIKKTINVLVNYKKELIRYCDDNISDIRVDYDQEYDGVRISYKRIDSLCEFLNREFNFTIKKQGEDSLVYGSYLSSTAKNKIVKSIPYDTLYNYVTSDFSSTQYKLSTVYIHKGINQEIPLLMDEQSIIIGNNDYSIMYYMKMDNTIGIKKEYNQTSELIKPKYFEDRNILKHMILNFDTLPCYVQEHWDTYVGEHKKVKSLFDTFKK